MDLIREHLIYKDVPLHICMKALTPIEHYEVVRLLLATRTKDVHICTHSSTNEAIQSLLKQMSISYYSCLDEERRNQEGIFLAPPSGTTAGASSVDTSG